MRTMFNDLNVGDRAVVPCILLNVSPRKTKSQKDYLTVTAFDGMTQIVGNFWDWAGKAVPECSGIVYNINCTVSEYNGAKQLTIHGIISTTDYAPLDFVPSSDKDVADIYKDAYAFASEKISDNFLRDLVINLFDVYQDKLLSTPAALSIHHAYVAGTLIHSLSTAKIAYAIGLNVHIANIDLIVAGALLHDFGKLMTYDFDGAAIVMTDTGRLYEHMYMGAKLVDNTARHFVKYEADIKKLELLIHIILSHHGAQEYGAVVTPQCIEAVIVNHADSIDAASEVIKINSENAQGRWTDKVYTMNNRPVTNFMYTQTIMSLEAPEIEDEQ